MRSPGTNCRFLELIAIVLGLFLATAGIAPSAHAQQLTTYSKAASFDDVKFDLANAITNRGLVVDFTGNVGAMLTRTGKDVGSSKVIYKNAEYVSFCSAKLSRDMMEADAGNAGFCPFVMFIYEAAATPGTVVVGYRQLPATGSEASRKALAAVAAMLDGIAKEATK